MSSLPWKGLEFNDGRMAQSSDTGSTGSLWYSISAATDQGRSCDDACRSNSVKSFWQLRLQLLLTIVLYSPPSLRGRPVGSDNAPLGNLANAENVLHLNAIKIHE